MEKIYCEYEANDPIDCGGIDAPAGTRWLPHQIVFTPDGKMVIDLCVFTDRSHDHVCNQTVITVSDLTVDADETKVVKTAIEEVMEAAFDSKSINYTKIQ